MSLNFAFLVLEEHPYGREMLKILLERGLVPSAIVQEVSEVGDTEREKFLARIAGQPTPPRLTQLVADKNIPLYCVANHNSDHCKELLAALQPDVLALGGTRIIKPKILEVPRRATVNSHPGLLPYLRGSASVGWVIQRYATGSHRTFHRPRHRYRRHHRQTRIARLSRRYLREHQLPHRAFIRRVDGGSADVPC